MAERRQVLYDLRVSYSGPFVAEELYAAVDKWITGHGYDKEHKKKLEHVTQGGKKIEWLVQIHTHLDDLHHGLIVLRVLMDNITEVTMKKGKKNYLVNNGDVLVNIDAFIQSHIHATFYHSRPVYYFYRAMVDRFIKNFWSFKWDGTVGGQGHDLFKTIRHFFDEERRKYV
ncbi:MAG TPA: hypothetical protein VI564_01980 [Candidatus Nanoarchaeia archaeon]|nr:hypothetical protein [Candidatus Nanoarchaeia archaeon]